MASRVDFSIDQGANFELTFDVKDDDNELMDLSDYTATAQLRKHYASTNAVNFTTEIVDSAITLTLTAAQTANILAGRFVYDVQIEDSDDNITRVIEGVVTITPVVTRP